MKRMNKRQGMILSTGLACAVALTACGGAEENDVAQDVEEGGEAADEDIDEEEAGDEGDEDEAAEDDEAEDEVEDGEFPVTVEDYTGEEVTIDEAPEEIVSLQASFTETLFEIGAGDNIVGVTDFCDYPEEAEDIDTVGGQEIDEELIMSKSPDVLFATSYHYESHEGTLEQFEEAGTDVVVIDDETSFDGVYDKIELMGTAAGELENAEATIEDMQAQFEAISEQAEEVEEEKKVWVEVAPAPEIFTTGTNTFMHEMLETINAENAAEDLEGWASVTEEEAVERQPDVIITTYHADDLFGEVADREGWENVPAIENERVHQVEENTVVRPGPRLAEGVETLAEQVYPDVFAD
ncbi:iron complex transport system substrate-binding protein [Salsuginibacillus halophilus]|uniref:Iron complex transport system substrate-binding protein n=1 Tax=Salsuginibacillus halophilus TaxID=517424 RepID=A0A2P8HL25_9BACI|nr:ABC transporter substrate-binding protein [Salsuginibacillus halophilus]PSL46914.1 iron complex transport system substrate-binding protein [Salsuginibacillus halophilus]